MTSKISVFRIQQVSLSPIPALFRGVEVRRGLGSIDEFDVPVFPNAFLARRPMRRHPIQYPFNSFETAQDSDIWYERLVVEAGSGRPEGLSPVVRDRAEHGSPPVSQMQNILTGASTGDLYLRPVASLWMKNASSIAATVNQDIPPDPVDRRALLRRRLP